MSPQMKKVLAICISIILLVGIGFTVSAAPNGFVSSPSASKGPVLISSSTASTDCTAKPSVVPYSEREKLSAEDRKLLEDAYNGITNTNDLTSLNSDLANLAKDMKIDSKDLGVSDLFTLNFTDCDSHDGHGHFDITLKPETVKNFVALMRLVNGKWEVVKDAKVEGEHLKFTSDASYPYAIITNAGLVNGAPQTGDNSNVVLYIVLMAVSAISLVVIWKKSKKNAE
jgi:hypothetical protein